MEDFGRHFGSRCVLKRSRTSHDATAGRGAWQTEMISPNHGQSSCLVPEHRPLRLVIGAGPPVDDTSSTHMQGFSRALVSFDVWRLHHTRNPAAANSSWMPPPSCFVRLRQGSVPVRAWPSPGSATLFLCLYVGGA